jgi:hypothetical protein
VKRNVWICIAATFLLVGCTSAVSLRIEEKSTAFAACDSATQARLRQGNIRIGDTEDMVYIAFGKPAEVRTSKSPGTQNIRWIYRVRLTDSSEGPHTINMYPRGYTRFTKDPGPSSSRSLEMECNILFKDGKVAAVWRAPAAQPATIVTRPQPK